MVPSIVTAPQEKPSESFPVAPQRLPPPTPLLTLRADKLAALDLVVEAAIREKKLPGGVLWIEHQPAAGPPLIYHRAYGQRALVPHSEAMTEDTIFDAASLTKVVATTPAILRLVEEGKVDPDAPVAKYLPVFAGNGKERVTIRQLLTHTSGLRPGLPLIGMWSGAEAALKLIAEEKLQQLPGTKFVYSDINFITLGEVVRSVTGESLDVFTARTVFAPLGMADTGFRPAVSERIAPTEQLKDGTVLRGVVHDPTARRLGGVAGHAGLFTTTADLAQYARAWLATDETKMLRRETRLTATAVQSAPGLPRRGLGWDIDSPYAGPRGAVFPVGSFGHTGWTGTSLWLDPFSRTFVIFMSNRNHPTEEGDVRALRRTVGTLAAEAVPDFDFQQVPGALPRLADSARGPAVLAHGQLRVWENGVTRMGVPGFPDFRFVEEVPIDDVGGGAADGSEPTPTSVLTGLDVLERDGFRSLRGQRVGLITNHTGHDRERRTTIDQLFGAPEVKLVALFSPEHGIRGALDEAVKDGRDAKTGLPIYSLYGERRAPTPEQLAGLEVLVFDIQDIGCRFYTYISTLGNCLEAAARAKVRFVVLDRPNPLGGEAVAGPVLSAERSFVAWHELPVTHGMTAGELARLFNFERKLGADLNVIRCEGWRRADWFDATGLPWTNPSPNMRRLTAAALYPGVGLLEVCRLSVGRGTDTPFEVVGAPYVHELEFSGALNGARLPGVRFVPIRFTPTASVFQGTNCGGVQVLVTDRAALRPLELGMTLARTLHRLYPAEFGIDKLQRLLGDAPTLEALKVGRPIAEIVAGWEPALTAFRQRRSQFLLY